MGDRRTPSRYVGKAVLSSAVERFNVLTSLNLDYGGGILVSLNGDLYKDVSFLYRFSRIVCRGVLLSFLLRFVSDCHESKAVL